MYAIEFETDITNRFIEIKEFDKIANQHARVIILVGEPSNNPIQKISLAGALQKYAKPELIENEKEIAWDAVVKDKSALS